MNIESLLAPESVQQQLGFVNEKLDGLLGKELIGIYLHGSLALDDFNIENSDIDLIVVVKNELALDHKKSLAKMMLELSLKPSPVELSVLTLGKLHPWRHPCPFEFHFGESWRERYKHGFVEPDVMNDGDLAGHLTVLYRRGLVLSGSPIASVFPEIPGKDYLNSVLDDLEWSMDRLAEQPVYAILNHCRTYAYICEGKVLSKGEGGDWTLPRVSKRYRKLIEDALSAYRCSKPYEVSTRETEAFIKWLSKRIDDELKR